MKKYIIIVASLVFCYLLYDYCYYHLGIYIDFGGNKQVETFIKAENGEILMKNNGEYEPYTIKGVNMGSGIPGKWATDYAIDKETYLRWFSYMQDMGANTLRIYTIQSQPFYEAFYEYNKDRENPLYLIHGIWVNDYVQNSRRDAYSDDFYGTFLEDTRTMIDIVHGKKKLNMGRVASAGHGSYTKDISPWVIGYILGVEWEDLTVAYTDDLYQGVEGYTGYSGKYMYTSPEASPFEVMLARVGDTAITYESARYGEQRLVAFSNWPTTDPFDYPQNVKDFFMKCAYVDVENIKTTEEFISGQFASYHVYPYYPDYLSFIDDWQELGIGTKNDFITSEGELNTYKAYLKMLTNHHTMPVVISEFGVSTGRGMAQKDKNTNRNQGYTSESEQGDALIECWEDILSVGCNGGCVFTWQDEWFKRTWNTMYAVDLKRTPYWSDVQTNEQYFGLLSFDPGKEESVCYVDGDISEWTDDDLILDNDDYSLSAKYDERSIYLLAEKKAFDFSNETIYIPIDVTQKTGSNYCENYNIKFEKDADFLIVIKGKDESRVQVQERYEVLRSTYSQNVHDFDTYVKGNIPEKNSPKFVNIDMILQTATALLYHDNTAPAEVYETGKLRYGNANPKSESFDSLADFIVSGDFVEIRLPWQLLNFADPSEMKIHDDYYDENYGVEHIKTKGISLGIGQDDDRIPMKFYELEGWNNRPTSHERLKKSYYVMQNLWKE